MSEKAGALFGLAQALHSASGGELPANGAFKMLMAPQLCEDGYWRCISAIGGVAHLTMYTEQHDGEWMASTPIKTWELLKTWKPEKA